MTNHPSRGWRRRAELAAAQIVLRLGWQPDAVVQCYTRDQLERLVAQVAIDAYAAGRADVQQAAKERA